MLSKTEIEFLKNPQSFSADYSRVIRHRVKVKAEDFRAQIALLQGCGALGGNELSVINVTKTVTSIQKIVMIIRAQNKLLYAKERREWDSNPCGPGGPRALKARALTTLPSRH